MHRRICLILCFVLLMTGWTASFAQATEIQAAPLVQASTKNGMVRVHLSSMGDPTEMDITVAGSYTADGNHDMTLTSGETLHIDFDKSTGQITMVRGGQRYAMGQAMALRRHAAKGSNGLRIAQTRMPDNLYPGDLHLTAQRSGSSWRLYAIVHVYIEYYLYGVVPYEMGNSANIEALKAQAVAARTYTVNKMNLRKNSLYDVVDTTNDQVYYGNSDTTANCTAAVDATRGIVVMNGEALTGTYYTASNGGQTESAANRFNASGYEYLGIKDDPFDLMNSAAVKRSVTVYKDNTSASQDAAIRSQLDSKARSAYGSNASVTRINAITPHTPMYASPSRLYTKLDFDVTIRSGSSTRSATLTLDIFSELEKALGMSINSSRNELWTVETYNDSFKLVARRFGHGVGMSQRGAMQMGAMGYTYEQILGFYYEGCRRVRYAFTHTILSSVESGGNDTIVNTEPPADITTGGGYTAAVRLSGVNDRLAIRSGASENASVLTSVVNGGLVTVLARGDSWTLVRLGQIVGYAPTSALRFDGTPPTSSSETPSTISQWATVQCNGTLNLRTSPSLSAGVQASIPNGAVLCVFRTENGWANVQYGASVGWASMDFLRMSSSYPMQITGQGSTPAVVNIPGGSGTVNLRETASTTSRVLAAIRHGSPVTVLANDGSWCYVQVDGYEGYMMTKFLALNGEAVAPPQEDAPTLGNGEQEAIVKTASGTLNLRQQPTTASGVLMTIPRGESIVVTNRGTEWCAVRYAGISGYVMTKFLSFPADENAAPTSYAIVATQSGPLNMRRQPTTGSSVVVQIPKGARVGVISQSGEWSQVSYNGSTGYVMSSYLRAEGGTTAPDVTGKYARVTTSGGGLNLRETASADARVLLSIPRGEVLEVQSHVNGWAKVSYAGATGYVMDKFLTFTDEKPESGGSAAPTAAWVNTTSGGLNLREMADPNALVLITIPRYAQVELLIDGDSWCKVRYDRVTGYVMSQFLTTTPPESDSGVRYVNTTFGGLNLRELPSADARVLLSIPKGTAVTLLAEGEEWCKIQFNEHIGYVMTKFLAKE